MIQFFTTMALIQPPPSNELQLELGQQALELLAKPELRDLIQDINNKYLYWDKVKHLCPDGIQPEVLWTAVTLMRSMSAKWLKFGNTSFSFILTDRMMQLLNLFDLNIGGTLGTQSLIPENDKNYYVVNSIMEEAIASSQMEGASTTRKVAKDMLRSQQKPINKSQRMIVNNFQTIQYLSAHRNELFSIEQLKIVHHLITANTLDNSSYEGKFRDNNDIIVQDAITGAIAHIPPRVEDINVMLEDLCRFANNNNPKDFIHPIIKAIIIHFILAYIHPFVDGNGRTARSLFYWYMLQHNYHLIEYLSISRVIYKSKKSYEKAFLQTEADGLDMSYFILYNLEAMNTAFNDLQNYLQRKMAEHDDVAYFLRIGHINQRQARILQTLCNKPNKTIQAKEAANKYGTTAITARADLQGLVKLGLLKEIPLNAKTIVYMAEHDCAQRIDELTKQ